MVDGSRQGISELFKNEADSGDAAKEMAGGGTARASSIDLIPIEGSA